MDFDWTPSQTAFRERLRDLLEREVPADWHERGRVDPSSSVTSAFSRAFCPKLADEGLLIPHWPKEAGGEGLDAFHHWILGEEMAVLGDPRSYQYMNINWVGPAIRRFGSEAQKAEYLPRITGGAIIFCQGFSEPNAGSDLAALRTRAEPTNDGWVVNGSKIWTSGASLSDVCFLLARTGEGRRDITAFLVPMDTPGIEARIVPGFVGERSFHEVFFTDVQVRPEWLIGREHGAWEIVLSILADERIGSPRYYLTMFALDMGVRLLAERGELTEQALRKAGEAMSALIMARYMCLQVVGDRVKDRPVDGKTPSAKYAVVLGDRLTGEFLGEFLSEDLIDNANPVLSAAYRRTSATGIAGGSAEMLLNGVARDLLALPRE